MSTIDRISTLTDDLRLLADLQPALFNKIAPDIERNAGGARAAVHATATLTAEEAAMGASFPGGREAFSRAKALALGRIARLHRTDRERLARMHGSWNWAGQSAAIDREGLLP